MFRYFVGQMESNFILFFMASKVKNVFFVQATCLVYKILLYVFSHVFQKHPLASQAMLYEPIV